MPQIFLQAEFYHIADIRWICFQYQNPAEVTSFHLAFLAII